MADLSKLTINTLTYNRQAFALRQMRFWSDSKVQMHVIDGSSKPINQDLLKDISKNIHYHHEPYSFEERLGIATKLVDTPYVINLSDDEFYVPSALEKCIDQLESNSMLVSCLGRCIGIFLEKGGVSAIPIYQEMKNYRNEKPSPFDRIVAHIVPYKPATMYAVQRTKVWRNSTNLMAEGKGKFSSPYVSEMEFEVAACYQGHVIVIEELMWLRNIRNPPVSIKQFNRKFQFLEWYNDARYAQEVEHFYDITASTLANIDGRGVQEVLQGLKHAIGTYEHTWKEPSLLLRLLSKVLPGKVKRFVRGWKSFQKTIQKVQKMGVHVDFEQLNRIEKFLLDNPVELSI